MIWPATLLFRPAMPIWLIVLLVLGFGAAAWFTYMRSSAERHWRVGLWCCRMAALLLLVWFVLLPARRTVNTEREPPVLVVAMDVSASMTERPGGSPESRAERAREFIQSGTFGEWVRNYRLAYFEMGRDLAERSLEEGGITFNAPRSNLSSGLNTLAQRFRAGNTAAVILLSDGLDHAGRELTAVARSIPVFIPALEEESVHGERIVRDAYVDEVSYPRTTVVDWDATVDVLVRRTAQGPSTFPIHLFQEGERIRSSTVEFSEGATFERFSFSVKPNRTGRLFYYVELETETDDNPANNIREFIIDVTSPENRVLYLEGLPRWEFKFMKRALASEEMFKSAAYVRGAGSAFVSFGESDAMTTLELPSLDHAELGQYKVLILGNMEQSALTESNYRSIRDFVDNGGGLLLLGGGKALGSSGWRDAPFLKEILPVTLEDGGHFEEGHFTVDLTDVGRTHPALRKLPYQQLGFPPILSLWRPVSVGGFSSVLVATPDGAPVVVTRRYGQGRVALLLTNSLWRWQLGGATGSEEKSLYNSFITQLVHWLAPGEEELRAKGLLQVVTAKSEFELRERITVGAIGGDQLAPVQPLTCQIVTPEGKRLTLPMHGGELGDNVGLSRKMRGYLCEFSPQAAGKYSITVVNPAGTEEAQERILVKKADRERTGAPVNRRFLAEVAQQTDGAFVPWKQRFDMLDDIPNIPHETQIVEERPIWNRWPLYVLLVGLFLSEWWLRRHHDLV
ncbi:MAG: glutamine amidotransferase [Candidatus Pacebacteria bacterium]|nr:glutamine amidotransferase [Candidatus Paceibacterota bacterium]